VQASNRISAGHVNQRESEHKPDVPAGTEGDHFQQVKSPVAEHCIKVLARYQHQKNTRPEQEAKKNISGRKQHIEKYDKMRRRCRKIDKTMSLTGQWRASLTNP
jgi:hypothetical protein